MQVYGIFHELAYIAAVIKWSNAVAQAQILKIKLFANLKYFQALYISPRYLMNEIGVRQSLQIIDDRLCRYIDLLRFKIFANVLRREKAPCVIGQVSDQ